MVCTAYQEDSIEATSPSIEITGIACSRFVIGQGSAKVSHNDQIALENSYCTARILRLGYNPTIAGTANPESETFSCSKQPPKFLPALHSSARPPWWPSLAAWYWLLEPEPSHPRAGQARIPRNTCSAEAR